MLDKSVPYVDITMKREAGVQIPRVELPRGYSFATFRGGDEREWARVEVSVGEFAGEADALGLFDRDFRPHLAEVGRRMVFVEAAGSEKVGTVTSWWGMSGGRRYPLLSWLGVSPAHQGKGVGKALVAECIRRLVDLDGNCDIYLHTQTWSYVAVGIYLASGFRFMRASWGGDFGNDYGRAAPILREKMGPRFREIFADA